MKNEEHNVSMAEVACHTPTPRKSADDYVKTLIEAKQVVDLWALHAPGLYVATRPRKHHWPLSCQQLHTASVKCIRRFYVSKITQRAFRSWLLEANHMQQDKKKDISSSTRKATWVRETWLALYNNDQVLPPPP